MKLSGFGLLLLLPLLIPLHGLAGTVYEYQGKPYSFCLGPACTTAGGMTATIEVTPPLAANTTYVSATGGLSGTVLLLLSWSISDGVSSLSNATPNVGFLNQEYEFITDSSGQIAQWLLVAGAPTASPSLLIGTQNLSSQTTQDTVSDVASLPTYHLAVSPSPGAWTVAIPEPGSIGLCLGGILAILAAGKPLFPKAKGRCSGTSSPNR